MFGEKSSWPALGVALAVFLAVMLPLFSWGAEGPQPVMVEKPPILETCALVSDSELDTMRGCYDAYYFGMDIIVNLTGGTPVTLVPHPGMPPETVITSTGISYQNSLDPSVVYRGGIGPSSIYQTVQVMGDGKIVTGVVNLNILVPQSLFTTGVQGLNLPNGSQTGLNF